MNELSQAKAALENADAVLITAGAGMGVDSGLPDFRGDAGFWKAYPFAKQHGLSFSEMANAQWFDKDPATAWAFYGHRLNLYRDIQPHQGFYQLLEFCRDHHKEHFVFTSNVDGQFQKAGYPEDRIVECHGSIHALQCSRGCSDRIWSADQAEIEVDFAAFRAIGELPRCDCGAVARPNILMFYDWQWIGAAEDRQRNRFERWLRKLDDHRSNLAVVELGAGTSVPTIRFTSEKISKRFQAPLIRINPTEPHGPKGCIPVAMTAKAALSRIL